MTSVVGQRIAGLGEIDLDDVELTDSTHIDTGLRRPGFDRDGAYRRCGPAICVLGVLLADIAAFAAAIAVVVLAQQMLLPQQGGIALTISPLGDQSAWFGLVMLLAGIIVYLASHGRYSERVPFWRELRTVVCASLSIAAALIVLSLLAPRLPAIRVATAALMIFPFCATLAHVLVKRGLSAAGTWTRPVVIIGNGQSAAQAEAALMADPSLGYRIVRRIDPASLTISSNAYLPPPSSMLSPVPVLTSLLAGCGARRVLIALDEDSMLQRQVVEAVLRERVAFALVSRPPAFPTFTSDAMYVFGHDPVFLSFRDGLSHPFASTFKAVIDVTLAGMLLAFAAPLFLLIAFAARLDGGPALYAHRRVGAGGRPFDCLKFRTMVVDGDRVLNEVLASDPVRAEEWRATRKLTDDPRITRVGRFLRQTSLDELPQLINVIRLEMSLVGPRPIVESEVPFYGEHIAHYYATRPGVTGLWQVSGRSNTSYARRVQLDVWYVNNWSLWNDIAVLLKTIPVVFGREGAR